MHQLLDPDGVLSVREIEAREGKFADFPESIAPHIVDGLKKVGIKQLYTHQKEAIEAILARKNTIITTSTASGKSMIYTVPLLNNYLANSSMTALYLSPAKALGQNQKKTMHEIVNTIDWPAKPPVIETCDGDTPYRDRKSILNTGSVIISTPDMLHYSLLPRHRQWQRLFKNLAYICLDEAHIYRGSLGGNIAHLIRRLRRIAKFYGADPTFILCSATIANALEFAKNLVGTEFNLVDNDGSPTGDKAVAFYDPPTYQRNGKEIRKLAHYEAGKALASCVMKGHRGIVFCRSRRIVENTYRRLINEFPYLKGKVITYKGTLTAESRRQLEDELFSGRAKGVIATNALEVGIDIGNLDVVIIAGFPGSISSVWQQAGRAGRQSQKALVCLMANEDPLDLYIVQNEEYLFTQSFEKAIVDPTKLSFLSEHLLMAAKELPLSLEDTEFWEQYSYFRAVNFLKSQDALFLGSMDPKTYIPAGEVPKFSLRGDSEKYKAVHTETGQVVEEYEYSAVLSEAFPGGIIYSMGRPYLVQAVDMEKQIIELKDLPQQLQGYTTKPDLQRFVQTAKADRKNEHAIVPAYAGVLTVVTKLMGYFLIDPTGKRQALPLPQEIKPEILETTGIWLAMPEKANYVSVHGVKHLLHVIIPWLSMAERSDIGTHLEGDTGIIYVFDRAPGGVGIAESALDEVNAMLEKAFHIVDSCDCYQGCVRCIYLPSCPARNDYLNKEETLVLLGDLLGRTPTKHTRKTSFDRNKGKSIKNQAELRLKAREFEIKEENRFRTAF
jgi:DEAD/DEAH box helicase domain-containing protein